MALAPPPSDDIVLPGDPEKDGKISFRWMQWLQEVWKCLQQGSFTSGTAVDTTSGTTHDFAIPAGTKVFYVAFDQVGHSGSGSPGIQLGDAGGIESTNYVSQATYVSNTTQGATSDTTGFWVLNTGSTHDYSGVWVFNLINPDTNTWSCSVVLSSGLSPFYTMQVAGSKALSSELTTVRITTDSGATFDEGQANITYAN